MRQRDGYATGTCADISNSKWHLAHFAKPFEHDFNQVLRLGPRDKNTWVNIEFQPPKFLLTGQILGGNTFSTPRQQAFISRQKFSIHILLRVRVEPRPVVSKQMKEQQFSCERSRWHL